jgi:hypothetical protein
VASPICRENATFPQSPNHDFPRAFRLFPKVGSEAGAPHRWHDACVGRSQLLINNRINRYLINSPLLPAMTKHADGSLTLYTHSPGKAMEANRLPAPDDTLYLVMRLYWPKETPPSILPAGEGTWKSPAIVAAA